MKSQIFPKEIMDNSVLVHQFILSKKRRTIYGILLLVLFAALFSLPFIFIDVYSSASGMVKPIEERVVLQSVQHGRVVFSTIEPHRSVRKGDTLLLLEKEQLEEKVRLFRQKVKEKKDWIFDLKRLIEIPNLKTHRLTTQKYIAEKTLYDEQLRDLRIKLEKAKRDFNRNQSLFNNKIIAPIEMEQMEFEFDLANNNLSEFKKRIHSQWQSTLNQEQITLAELESELEQLNERKSQYVLTAPIDGTLVNVSGIQKNAYVISGQPLAEISPESSLIVNCYVNPTDIGYLKRDAPAKFQIDAYNYNQWGWATGKITTIGNDIEWIQNKAVFQVQCTLNEKELFLKNGVAGKLKKGMTVKAQFFRARRSLWQLLFDKVDDWFNPVLNSKET